MKKSIVIGRVLIIVFILLSILYFYPRKINCEYNAIMYRLGDNKYSEKITVRINGHYSKGLLKGDKFTGNITLGDHRLSEINTRFDRYMRGLIFCLDEKTGQFVSYGDIYAANKLTEFTLCILEENKRKNGGKIWSNLDGLMISAPASNRTEALEISNKLMKNLYDVLE